LQHRPASPEERSRLWIKHWRTDLAAARRCAAAAGADVVTLGQQARALVRRHWHAIERVAAALARNGALTAGDLGALIGRRPHTTAADGRQFGFCRVGPGSFTPSLSVG